MKSKMFEKSLAYKPFVYPWAMEYAVDHGKMHWGEWECQLQEDVNQWKGGKITPSEKANITQILRLFTQTDVEVGGNYCDVFIQHFKNNELRQALLATAEREGVHQRAYALLNDTLGMDEGEYSAFMDFAAMKEKVEFMQAGRFIFPFDTMPELALKNMGFAIAQTICNEGMSLFSAFAMLLNYQRFGKMKGMCEIVEWSIRDESQHVEFMVNVFRAFCEEHPQILTDEFKREIYEMYRQAVALEDGVIDLTYDSGAVEGLSKDEVKEYIRYIADRRLIQLGLKPNFKVDRNPLSWLEWITSAASHKNFFEGRVTDYSKQGMVGEMFDEPVQEKVLDDREATPVAQGTYVFTRPNCPFCEKAKNFLKMKGVEFEVKEMDELAIEFLSRRAYKPIRSAPQIILNGDYVGTYDDLVAHFQK